MIDRNSGMSDKPQILKAAVMASCYFNARTGFTNNISNKEGAGVVDANLHTEWLKMDADGISILPQVVHLHKRIQSMRIIPAKHFELVLHGKVR